MKKGEGKRKEGQNEVESETGRRFKWGAEGRRDGSGRLMEGERIKGDVLGLGGGGGGEISHG